MESQKKTRNQSLYDFLECLQFEYIQAELRKKIYTKQKDVIYHTKVMNRKKEKIEDIADRNNLPTIFTDDRIDKQYKRIFYGDFGYPNFFYRDDEQRLELETKDYNYYYQSQSEISIQNEDSTIDIGRIIKAPERGVEVIVVKKRFEEDEEFINIRRVTRIL